MFIAYQNLFNKEAREYISEIFFSSVRYKQKLRDHFQHYVALKLRVTRTHRQIKISEVKVKRLLLIRRLLLACTTVLNRFS